MDVLPGLLWAYSGSPGERPVSLDPADVAGALATEDWVWLHVDLIDQRMPGWIGDLCTLSADASALFAGGRGLQMLQHSAEEMHGVCPDFTTDSARVSNSVGRFVFSVRERLLVTGRRQPLESVYRVRERLKLGAPHDSALHVFSSIVLAFAQTALQKMRDAEAELDEVEDRLIEAATDADRMALKDVRRLALGLHRPVAGMLQQLREEGEGAEKAGDNHEEAIFDFMAVRLGVLDQSIVHVSDRAKLLSEDIADQLAEDSNRSLRALTVMSALLMPGTLVVGVFGMNTGGLPFSEGAWGTWEALFLGVVCTILFYRALVKAGASLKF